MEDMITLRGWVGTEPTIGLTKHNTPYSRFRMSVKERRYDRERQTWVDVHTSWFNIVGYGRVAENIAESIRKGQPVIVAGRLQIKSYQRADGSFGGGADLVAASLGQDLALGIGRWNKRRDEPGEGARVPNIARIDGIGLVNPATGELTADEASEDPFDPGDYGEDQEFPTDDGSEEYALPEEAAGGQATAEPGPEERLLSA